MRTQEREKDKTRRTDGGRKRKTRIKVVEISLGKKAKAKKTRAESSKKKSAVKAKSKTTKSKTTAKKAAPKKSGRSNSLAKNTKSKKISAKETVPAKSTIAEKEQAAVLERELKLSEKIEKSNLTGNGYETPTPSPAMLRAFRAAAKEKQKKALERERDNKPQAGFLAKTIRQGTKYLADLRVHSPGTVGYFSTGGVEPGKALVRLAKVKGIDMIGITDYYNAEYIDIVKECSDGSVCIIPGVDMCCEIADCKEVFITALFPETHTSADVFRVLKQLEVPTENYGRRDYCLKKPFEEVLAIVEQNGGVIIPNRVDKTPYRKLAIPELVEKFGIHAFDLIDPENPEFFRKQWPRGGFTFFSFSNAYALAQIGSRVVNLRLPEPGFAGLKQLVQRRS